MTKLRILIATFAMLFVGASGLILLSPTIASAANCSGSQGQYLLTFPAWYRGLVNADCSVKKPGNGKYDLQDYIGTIVLNIVEIIMQLVAYTTVIFLIKGGFDYMLSQGDANQMTGAKNTIMNAVIGLVISLIAVAIIRLLGTVL